ncbi:hypothetical protein N7492_008783 [Penicillium capsulatum]|uniref:Uncharacterized protein n=1 Tax=Penicillium capsulatum TaxID=69766 RepID=A0A9W9LHL8_9EURO|nr:hypothetical protein N7492_008783 [Penicillium capsulatum]
MDETDHPPNAPTLRNQLLGQGVDWLNHCFRDLRMELPASKQEHFPAADGHLTPSVLAVADAPCVPS